MTTALKTLRWFLRSQKYVLNAPRFCSKDHRSSSEESSDSAYDERKFSTGLPNNKVKLPFPPLPKIPSGVFRTIKGEHISAKAFKGGCYQNPEYFSFHDMTFYDMTLYLRPFRNARAKTGRKSSNKGN